MNLDPAVLRVLIDRVFADVEEQQSVERRFAQALLEYPLYDSLRLAVTVDDIDSVIDMDASTDQNTRYLAAALARGLPSNPRLANHYASKWVKTLNEDVRTRVQALFSATDYIDLPAYLHDDMYRYIRAHWKDWEAINREWYEYARGGIIAAAVERLKNPLFPQTKDWVYLCVAAVDARHNEVVALLERYASNSNDMARRVANELLAAR